MASKFAWISLRAEADRLHLTYRVRIGGGDWEDVAETVRIVRVACRFGGARPYFVCPGVVNGVACGRRVPSCTVGALFPLPALLSARPRQPERERWDRALAPRQQDQAAPRRRSRHGCAVPGEAEGHVAADLRAAARSVFEAEMRADEAFAIRAERLLARIDSNARSNEKEFLAMTKTEAALPAETGGTEITRFNALRHGVLSRYTVLPWEDADEYHALVAALVAEHAPQGPTEEHLVEELAGIFWRKRRLRLAEAAAHRRGLDGTLSSYRQTVEVALVHIDAAGQSERVVDAIRATDADTQEDIRDMEEDEAMTRRALDLLGSRRNDAYEAALAVLREDTRSGGRTCWPAIPTNWRRTRNPPPPTPTGCAAFWRARCCRGSRPGRRNWPTGR